MPPSKGSSQPRDQTQAMQNARLDEAQAGIKIAREISITSDMQITPPLWQKAKKT